MSLTAPAPARGAVVNLSNANPAAKLPAHVTIPANATAANFSVSTTPVGATTIGNITSSYSGVIKTATLTVNPAAIALSSLTLNPSTVIGGSTTDGTLKLTVPAPAGGIVVALSSNKRNKASVPANITVPAGSGSVTFTVTTVPVSTKTIVTIRAHTAASKRARR